jgi:hypothetical protein
MSKGNREVIDSGFPLMMREKAGEMVDIYKRG